ncbi:MAG: hypothetical protein ACOC1K_05545 [Nanoarchaeota archaeon]
MLSNIQKFKNRNIQLYPSYGMNFILDENFYKNKLFIIVQRAATEKHFQILKMLKDNIFSKKTGTKIIYEIDDDLIDIPKWNMAYDYYEKNRKNCLKIIKICDGVTTSTEFLAKKLRIYNKNVVVNPNHLPKFLWGEPNQIKEKHKKPRILWSGSSNHFALPNSNREGGDFGKELLNFIRKTTDKYEWVFQGSIPKELMDLKDKITFYNWVDILHFPLFMKSLNVDMGLAPLMKHDFNRSKSNIKALEYTVSGIPGIYTNITPYENLTMACNTDEEIISNIELLASNDDKRKEVLNNDYEILKNQLFWENNNNIVKYINNLLHFSNRRLPNEN